MNRFRLAAVTAALVLAATQPAHGTHASAGTGAPGITSPAKASAQLATVRYIRRGLSVRPPHGKTKRGKVRMKLYNQYFLRTKSGERASIRFVDGTTIHMNQRTDALLRSPTVTYVKKGEVAQFLAPGTNHQMQTSSAVAAAIGTTYDVRIKGKKSIFVVLHGLLQVKNAKGTVLVKSNHESITVPNQAPGRPKAVDAKAVFGWTDTIPTPDLGENIALDANGGVIAGYSSDAGGQWSVRHINDGLLSEGWESADGHVQDQFVKLAFYYGAGGSYRIPEIIIDPAATHGEPADTDLKDFEIRVSSTNLDESSFTTVFRGTCQKQDALQHFRLPVAVVAKYVELVVLSNYGSARHVSVAEMEVVATTASFDDPGDAAVDSHGNVYVADSSNDRAQKLSPNGSVLATWGTKGHGNGQFVSPQAVAVDSEGNVYVADSFNNRIQKFSPSGQYLAQFGSFGLGPGQFRRPEGIALDGQGNMYVSDTATARIQKLSPSGAPLAQWGGYGSGPGEFSVPEGIALDRAGNIYVADEGNDRIQKLSPNGDPLDQWGKTGSGLGDFSGPYGVAVDEKGFVYVCDTYNDRIQKLSPQGKALSAWGKEGFSEGQFIVPTRITVDTHGKLYVADTGNARIATFSTKDGSPIEEWGTFGTVPQILGSPVGIALDSDNNVYVTDIDNHRIQQRAPDGSVTAIFGRKGISSGATQLGQFLAPEGIAVDSQGYIYVADTFNDRIQVMSERGPITAWGDNQPAGTSFKEPFDVAVDRHDNVYVADGGNNRIVKLSPGGSVLATWGSEGSGPGQFEKPRGVAVDAQGNVYVADTGNNRVEKLSPTGTFLTAWGSMGSAQGQFDGLSGVSLDSHGNVYVADTFNDRVEKFDSDGNFLAQFGGSFGPGNDQMEAPSHVALDSAGNMYITDTQNLRVVKRAPNGQILAIWE